jgi:5-methylcytosine-specific restriction protein A
MTDLQQECRRFYSRAAWKRLRKYVLRNAPLCAHCEKEGRIAVATDADHNPPLIEQLRTGLSGLDQQLIQPLCKSCHSRKTAREMRSC